MEPVHPASDAVVSINVHVMQIMELHHAAKSGGNVTRNVVSSVMKNHEIQCQGGIRVEHLSGIQGLLKLMGLIQSDEGSWSDYHDMSSIEQRAGHDDTGLDESFDGVEIYALQCNGSIVLVVNCMYIFVDRFVM